MSDVRVLIDLQEGVIELEGPIEFVEKHMAIFLPEMVIKEEEPETPRRRGRPAKTGKLPRKKKRVACAQIIDSLFADGYFKIPRGFGEIKQEVIKTEPGCSDNKIRQTLKNSIAKGALSSAGAGRGMKYTQVETP